MIAAALAAGTLAVWNGLDCVVVGFAGPGRVYVRVGNMLYSAEYGAVWARSDGKAGEYNHQVAAHARRAA